MPSAQALVHDESPSTISWQRLCPRDFPSTLTLSSMIPRYFKMDNISILCHQTLYFIFFVKSMSILCHVLPLKKKKFYVNVASMLYEYRMSPTTSHSCQFCFRPCFFFGIQTKMFRPIRDFGDTFQSFVLEKCKICVENIRNIKI